MIGKIRILFVDDEQRILDALRRTLYSMRHAWDISFTSSGKSALELLENKEFDVIVSDIRMPGMDGVELLSTIKKKYPSVIRFALSGQTSKESILQSIGPIHQYISKPCDLEELKTKINFVYSIREMFNNPVLGNFITQLESLPCMSATYIKLTHALQSQDATIDDIALIISQDMGMSARILQIANSAFFGIRQHVSSIAQAVKFLGLDTISSLVLTLKIFSQFKVNITEHTSLEQLWQHSLTVSQWAKIIMVEEKEEKKKADYAVIAGMLHDVGKLILMSYFPELYEGILSLMAEQRLSVLDAEKQILGTGHTVVGAYLLGLWGFDRVVLNALRYNHEPDMAEEKEVGVLPAVHVANGLANANSSGQAEFLTKETVNESYLESIGVHHKISLWREIVIHRPLCRI